MTLAVSRLPIVAAPLSRLDPRWRLAALVLFAAAVAVLDRLPPTLVAFAGAAFLASAARLPWRWYLARVLVVVPFLALFAVWLPFFVHDRQPVWDMGPIQVSQHGLTLAALLCLKALALMTVMLVLLATAPLHVTLQAAHALRVPALVVHLTLLTYRYVQLLALELARVRIALKVRGYRNRPVLHSYRTIGHVAGTLLVRSTERAERLGQAMCCRAFAGRFRTLTQFRTTWADAAVFSLLAASAAGLVAWDLIQR